MTLIGKCCARIGLSILSFTLLICISFFAAHAQVSIIPKPEGPEPKVSIPRDVKVLEEYNDKNGNIVRVVQYKLGLMRVTETITMPKKTNFGTAYRVPVNPDTLIKDSVLVVVNKSSYSLQIIYRKKILRTYKAVFGPRPLDNKCMEGDRCTPEGWFKITNKNPASKYTRFMGLSYPNDSCIARFNKLKAAGILPATAKIGGSVGIHGIWQGGDNMIDLGVGWTDGCVALRNTDIEELYKFVGVGTRVLIRK